MGHDGLDDGEYLTKYGTAYSHFSLYLKSLHMRVAGVLYVVQRILDSDALCGANVV